MQMCAYILTCLNFGHGWTEPLSEFVLLVLNEYGLLYGSDYPVTKYFSSDAWKLTIWQILVPNQGYKLALHPLVTSAFRKQEALKSRLQKPESTNQLLLLPSLCIVYIVSTCHTHLTPAFFCLVTETIVCWWLSSSYSLGALPGDKNKAL